MKKDPKKKKKFEFSSFGGMGAGLAIGVAIGVAMDNIGVGVALGVVFGVAMNNNEKEKNSQEKEEDES